MLISTQKPSGVNRSMVQRLNCTVKPSRDVRYIVIHYTGNVKDTALSNARYFMEKRAASAHFFVDETEICQSVELKDVAWHCGTASGVYYHPGCRNSNSIGVEMCCSGKYTVSTKTKARTAKFVAQLCRMVGIKAEDVDKYVLRHYDITHKLCPAQMAGISKEWTDLKSLIRSELRGVDDEVVEKAKMMVDGKEITVDRILKDGSNFIKIRDIANAVGYNVSAQGNVAVLTKK